MHADVADNILQSLRTKAVGPVCLLSEGQMAVSIVGTKNDDLTVVQGRGDMRSKKGKRFAKSYGKVILRAQRSRS